VTFGGEKGEFVVAGSDEGSVLLWHTAKPAKEGTDIALSEHDDIVSCVSAHQSQLLSGSWDHKYDATHLFLLLFERETVHVLTFISIILMIIVIITTTTIALSLSSCPFPCVLSF
jgi:WD40 repeat protein